jgi:hypothetical protein
MEEGNMPEVNNVPGGNVKINANLSQNQIGVNDEQAFFKRIILQELSQEESQVIGKYKKN